MTPAGPPPPDTDADGFVSMWSLSPGRGFSEKPGETPTLTTEQHREDAGVHDSDADGRDGAWQLTQERRTLFGSLYASFVLPGILFAQAVYACATKRDCPCALGRARHSREKRLPALSVIRFVVGLVDAPSIFSDRHGCLRGRNRPLFANFVWPFESPTQW